MDPNNQPSTQNTPPAPAPAVKTESTNTSSSVKHVMSFKKLLFLNIITFNFYLLYWGWKNWEIVKRATGRKMHTGIRGWFVIATSFWLFKDILGLAKTTGYTKEYNSTLYFGLFFLLNYFASFPALFIGGLGFWLSLVTALVLQILMTLAMFPAVSAMNYYLKNNKEGAEKFNIKPNIGLGVILLVLYLYMLSYTVYYFITAPLSNDYSQAIEASFVAGCMKNGGTKDGCECVYNEVRTKYTFEQFSQISKTGNEFPESFIEEVRKACPN